MHTQATKVLAVVAVVSDLGCVKPASCTDIGCISELELAVSDTSISDGMSASVKVTVGADTFECAGELNVDESLPDDPALACENLLVHATPDGLMVTVNALVFDTEEAVSISLDVDGLVVLDEAPLTVDWVFNQPNGPECPPVCSTGGASVSAAP